jgi:hypothetical protein
MNKKVQYIISLIFGFIMLIVFYTLLHEGGHAVVAIMYGGKVDKMVLGLNAHVQTSGAEFTAFGKGLFNSAGALLPVIFLTIAMIFYNRKRSNILYHGFYGVFSLMTASSLLAWVVIPVIALFAAPPPGDDVTKFIDNTQINPLVVALAAVLIIASIIFLIYKKGVLRKIKDIYWKALISNTEKHNTGLSARLIIKIALAGIIVVIGFAILIPKPVFEKSLSMEVNSKTEDVKLPFKLENSKHYDMQLELKAKGILTDIQIYSESGNVVYQNFAERCTIGTTLNLKKGDYEIVLTFLKNPVAMQEHFQKNGYKFDTVTLEQLKGLFDVSNSIENYPVSFSVTIK